MSINRLVTVAAALAISAVLAPRRAAELSAQTLVNHTSVATTSLSSLALLTAERERLTARFGETRTRALAPGATLRERADFVRFLHADLLPYLNGEGVVLYPAADSIAGIGGYATIAALIDREAIERVANMLGATGRSDAAAFRARTDALAALLETYFTKVQLLVLPVLSERLSEADLRALIARVEAERAESPKN